MEQGIFCSIDDVLHDRPGNVPFWRENGWVYRGGKCKDWLHSDSSHKVPKWWNLKALLRQHKYIYMGYAKCPNGMCTYCGETIPEEVRNVITKEVMGEG